MSETFVMKVGEREWWASSGNFRDDYIRGPVTSVVIRSNCYSRHCPTNWHSRGFDIAGSLAYNIEEFDPFQDEPEFPRCTLEYARNVLHEMGHEPSSLELYRLNGPMVYSI